MVKTMKKSSNKIDFNKSLLWLWPIYAVVLLLPIMVFGTSMELKGVYADFANQSNHIDVFSFLRSNFIVIMAFMSLVMCFLYFLEQKKVGKPLLCLVGAFVYLVAIFVSTYFSSWRVIAIFGFLDRFEGALVLVSYVIFLLTTYVLTYEKKQIQFLLFLILVSSSVVAIIGVLQFFGQNIFSSLFFQKIILGGTSLDMSTVEITKVESMVYATLYNSNYVGSFTALVFPLSLGLYFVIEKPVCRLVIGAHSALIFALLVACRSRAGFMGLIFGVVILISYFRKSLFQNKKLSLIFLIYLFIFLGMNDYSNGGLLAKFITINPRIEQEASQSERVTIESMKFKKETVEILTDSNYIVLKHLGDRVVFLNSKGEILESKKTSKGYIFNDSAYKDFYYNVYFKDSNLIVTLEVKRVQMSFFLKKEGVFFIGSQNKLYNEMPKVPSFGFKGRESLGSGRGFIWSRTFPILKETLVWGHGPDTFALYFPQQDFMGKLNVMRSANYIVDKPHNFYLQIFHDTGGVSLFAFLMLVVSYFYLGVFKKNSNIKGSFEMNVKVMITCSLLSYLIAGIFNDSVVYVAPYFWILLGLGFAIFHMKHVPQSP